MVRQARRKARPGSVLPVVVAMIMGAIIALAVAHVVNSWREPAPPDEISSMVIGPARGGPKADPDRDPEAAPPPVIVTGPAPRPEPRPPAASDRAGIQALAARYAAAVRAADAEGFIDCHDLERLLDAAEAEGVLPARHRGDRRGASSGVREALQQAAAEMSRHAWDRFEIRRVDALEDPDEVMVRFRLDSAAGPAFNGVWWLTRRPGAWKIYDAEDCLLGDRASLRLGAAGTARLESSGWTRQLPKLEQGRRHILDGEHQQAVDLLEPIQVSGTPEPIDGLRLTFLAVARAALGDIDGAERDAEGAVRLRGEVAAIDLVRAVAANGRGASQEALSAAQRYEREVGATAPSSLQLGLAQKGLGRRGDAIKTFRAGLADDPGSTELLMQVAVMLPRERMGELAADFKAMPDPAAAFEPLARSLLAAGANDAVVALAQQQLLLQPGDEKAAVLAADAHLAARRPAAATALLREAIAAAPDSKRPALQRRLADALLQEGRPVEAYAALPDPAAAFPLVADRLAARGDVAGLAVLVAEVQTRRPNDPSLPYYSGLVAERQGRLDEAARIYLKALRESNEEPLRRRLHRAAVRAMYRDGAMIKAYDVVPPRQETADLLAQLCAEDRDDRSLQRIYELHLARVPEDRVWRRWSAELAFLRGDYLAAKIAIDPVRAACLEHPATARWYDDRLVRTLLRLKRHDDAQRAAREATGRRDGDPLYEFVAYAAAGRLAESVRLARRLVELRYDPESLYEDADCGQALRSDPLFEPFREAFPRRTEGPRAPALAEQVWVDPDR